jgi:hypothetical protein
MGESNKVKNVQQKKKDFLKKKKNFLSCLILAEQTHLETILYKKTVLKMANLNSLLLFILAVNAEPQKY